MSARNLGKRSTIVATAIELSKPVKATTWAKAVDTINWCLAKGDHYVPWHFTKLNSSYLAATRYKFTPNGRAVYRKGGSFSAGNSFRWEEPLAAKETTAQDITVPTQLSVNLYYVAGNPVYAINAEDQDRVVLNQNTEDYGVERNSVSQIQPINSIDYQSLGGLFTAVAQPFRRYYLAQSQPATKALTFANATTTYAYLIKNGVILCRKVGTADTTGPVMWRFYCSASSALYGGTIKITNTKNSYFTYIVVPASAGLAAGFLWFETSFDATWTRLGALCTVTKTAHGFTTGDTVYVKTSSDSAAVPAGAKTITVTGANTFTFVCPNAGGAAGTLTHDLQFDCEDLTKTTGMPSETWNEFNIEFKSANALGTFYNASICAEEIL